MSASGAVLRKPAVMPVVETPYLNFWETVSYCRLEGHRRPDAILYRAIAAGVLRPVGKCGGKMLFTRDVLDAWIRGKAARESK